MPFLGLDRLFSPEKALSPEEVKRQEHSRAYLESQKDAASSALPEWFNNIQVAAQAPSKPPPSPRIGEERSAPSPPPPTAAEKAAEKAKRERERREEADRSKQQVYNKKTRKFEEVRAKEEESRDQFALGPLGFAASLFLPKAGGKSRKRKSRKRKSRKRKSRRRTNRKRNRN